FFSVLFVCLFCFYWFLDFIFLCYGVYRSWRIYICCGEYYISNSPSNKSKLLSILIPLYFIFGSCLFIAIPSLPVTSFTRSTHVCGCITISLGSLAVSIITL